jgi:hypothetical protein
MSSYVIQRTVDEIDKVLNLAHDQEERGDTAYQGMSLEQGVAQGIEWTCGLGGDASAAALEAYESGR